MPTNYNPFQKAINLLVNGKVKRSEEDKHYYIVSGESQDYEVYFNQSRVSCECEYFTCKGVQITRSSKDRETGYTKGYLCSHIMAVILFEYESLRRINADDFPDK